MSQALRDQYNEFVKEQSAQTSEGHKVVRKKRASTNEQGQPLNNESQWEFGPMEKQWMETYYPGAFLHPKVLPTCCMVGLPKIFLVKLLKLHSEL